MVIGVITKKEDTIKNFLMRINNVDIFYVSCQAELDSKPAELACQAYFILIKCNNLISRSGGMVDAQRSERCVRKDLEVRVLSPTP